MLCFFYSVYSAGVYPYEYDISLDGVQRVESVGGSGHLAEERNWALCQDNTALGAGGAILENAEGSYASVYPSDSAPLLPFMSDSAPLSPFMSDSAPLLPFMPETEKIPSVLDLSYEHANHSKYSPSAVQDESLQASSLPSTSHTIQGPSGYAMYYYTETSPHEEDGGDDVFLEGNTKPGVYSESGYMPFKPRSPLTHSSLQSYRPSSSSSSTSPTFYKAFDTDADTTLEKFQILNGVKNFVFSLQMCSNMPLPSLFIPFSSPFSRVDDDITSLIHGIEAFSAKRQMIYDEEVKRMKIELANLVPLFSALNRKKDVNALFQFLINVLQIKVRHYKNIENLVVNKMKSKKHKDTQMTRLEKSPSTETHEDHSNSLILYTIVIKKLSAILLNSYSAIDILINERKKLETEDQNEIEAITRISNEIIALIDQKNNQRLESLKHPEILKHPYMQQYL